jgi:hypothetical protein
VGVGAGVDVAGAGSGAGGSGSAVGGSAVGGSTVGGSSGVGVKGGRETVGLGEGCRSGFPSTTGIIVIANTPTKKSTAPNVNNNRVVTLISVCIISIFPSLVKVKS